MELPTKIIKTENHNVIHSIEEKQLQNTPAVSIKGITEHIGKLQKIISHQEEIIKQKSKAISEHETKSRAVSKQHEQIVRNYEKELKQVQKDNVDLKLELTLQRDANKQIEDLMESLKSENKELTENYKREVEKNTEVVQQLQKANDDLKMELTTQNDIKEQLKDVMQSLKKQNNTLCKNYKEKIENNLEDLQKLQVACNNLKLALNNQKDDTNKIKCRVETLKFETKELREKCKKELEKRAGEIQELQRANSDLNQELNNQLSANKQITDTVQSLKIENNKLHESSKHERIMQQEQEKTMKIKYEEHFKEQLEILEQQLLGAISACKQEHVPR